jgi:hypothetical protein
MLYGDQTPWIALNDHSLYFQTFYVTLDNEYATLGLMHSFSIVVYFLTCLFSLHISKGYCI